MNVGSCQHNKNFVRQGIIMDPTIVYEYRNEDSVYMVYQSAVRDQREDSRKGIAGTS